MPAHNRTRKRPPLPAHGVPPCCLPAQVRTALYIVPVRGGFEYLKQQQQHLGTMYVRAPWSSAVRGRTYSSSSRGVCMDDR